jgi:nucleoside diphosphate kinase
LADIAGQESTSAVPGTAFQRLTMDPRKAAAYRLDPYARESLALFDWPGARAWLHGMTFVVLKPDAIAGRRCLRILDVLAAEGWLPTAAQVVRFDPLLTREIWRFQFNAASCQRIAVVDHLLGSGPSLLVLLADTRQPVPLPASVRLTAAKGPAEPRHAGGRDLRTKFGRVNGLFNFIHTADEPADVMRELRLFCYQTGTRWLRSTFGRQPPRAAAPSARCPARRLVAEVARDIPAHDLDLDASLLRLAARDDGWGSLARVMPAERHIGAWLGMLARQALPEGAARWDVLTVLTGWIDCNEPGVAPLLATPGAAAWAAGQEDLTRV